MLKTLLLRLLALLRGSAPKPEPILPTSTSRIDFADLYGLLRQEAPMAEIFLSDKDYLLCSESDIASFIIRDKTNRCGYIKNAYDCDDFAYRLMGQFSVPRWADLAFGIIWTDKHAMNCFVSEDNIFYFVEPQTDLMQYGGLLPSQGDHIRLIVM